MLLIVFICVFSALIPLDLLLIYQFSNTLNIKFENDINIHSKVMAKNLISPLSFEDKDGTFEMLSSLKVLNYVNAAFILDNNVIKIKYVRDSILFDDKALFLLKNKIDINHSNENYIFIKQTPLKFKEFKFGKLIIVADKSSLNDELKSYFMSLIFIEMFILILTLLISIKLEKIISQPLEFLASLVKQIPEPTNINRIEIKNYQSFDEIGIIYEQFDIMIDKLIEYRHLRENAENNLNQLNLNLELIVEQRTNELLNLNFNLTDEIQKRKTAESELTQLNSSKDRLFEILAHDLKNPLAGLYLTVELLETNFELYDSDKIYDKISKIKSTLNSINILIDNLLSWSRSQSKNQIIFIEQLSLTELINDSIQTILNSIEQKQIELKNNINSEYYIQGDRNMLKTVIRNIISNALKFSPRLGTIEIKAYDNNDFIELLVIDNGVGIDQQRLGSIFDENQNITTNGTEEEKGTGLGLILCKDFIEKNGGSIWIDSQINKGTTVTLFFAKSII